MLEESQQDLVPKKYPKSEWKRVQHVIKILKKYKKICLSIDTRKSDLMVKSIYGVDLINDVSGFEFDKKSLLKIKFKVSKVLHHMQGTPIQCK